MNLKLFGKGLSIIAFICALSLFPSSVRADVVFVSGNVSGVWGADSIIVTDSVRVPPGQTLTIEPGVQVLFLDYWGHKFLIDQDAVLYAVGTETDTIKFLPLTAGNFHKGLDFINSSVDSRLEYCLIRHGFSSGVYCDNTDLTIRNCLIDSNRTTPSSVGAGGVTLINSSDALIENNTFRHNEATEAGGYVSTGRMTLLK
jgi:polygalacturonase